MKFFALLFLLAPVVALFAHPSGARWHVILLPYLMPGGGHMVLTVTSDSLLTTFEPINGDSTKPRLQRDKERMKIIARHLSPKGDTAIYIVTQGRKEALAFRFITETHDRCLLQVAENISSKKPKFPPDSEYVNFGNVVGDAKYAELLKLKDVATITKEEIVFILKSLRETFVNLKARLDYQRLHTSMAMPLMFELSQRATDDLEALGYSPLRWSRDAEEIIEEHRSDPQVVQLLEELRQLTQGKF